MFPRAPRDVGVGSVPAPTAARTNFIYPFQCYNLPMFQFHHYQSRMIKKIFSPNPGMWDADGTVSIIWIPTVFSTSIDIHTTSKFNT